MSTFLLNKTLLYVDRPSEFAILLAYTTGDHKDLTVIDGKNESIFSLQVCYFFPIKFIRNSIQDGECTAFNGGNRPIG
jgi:hypothetical protein